VARITYDPEKAAADSGVPPFSSRLEDGVAASAAGQDRQEREHRDAAYDPPDHS
jgi:hypothetical protein